MKEVCLNDLGVKSNPPVRNFLKDGAPMFDRVVKIFSGDQLEFVRKLMRARASLPFEAYSFFVVPEEHEKK